MTQKSFNETLPANEREFVTKYILQSKILAALARAVPKLR